MFDAREDAKDVVVNFMVKCNQALPPPPKNVNFIEWYLKSKDEDEEIEAMCEKVDRLWLIM
ncbi:hypothetical protein ACVXZY_14195 [Staphylococcus aureus]